MNELQKKNEELKIFAKEIEETQERKLNHEKEYSRHKGKSIILGKRLIIMNKELLQKLINGV